jgi:oxygen-independent coproporphyrinogen III oxidase
MSAGTGFLTLFGRMNSAGLYIHIPFCKHKCNYCDFFSITNLDVRQDFLDALKTEISLLSTNPPFGGFSFSTIYFGGGTPSLLSPTQISDILSCVKNAFPIQPNAEISIEVNPGTTAIQQLEEYYKVGVNRLTIGVQSFNNGDLIALTRIHDAEQAEKTILSARQAGFTNVGIDLIFGIPGQTIESWKANLEKACLIEIEHISMYGLTFEEGTPLTIAFEKGRVAKCLEEDEREMFLLGISELTKNGFEQYEISNFAKPGYESNHNQKYWDGSLFLSLGPSAHSFDGKKRWANFSDFNQYQNLLFQKKLPIEFNEKLTTEMQMEEAILLGLRQKKGIHIEQFKKNFGCDFMGMKNEFENKLGKIDLSSEPFSFSQQESLLCLRDGHLCLTQQGLLLYDSVCGEFVAMVCPD